MSKEHEDPYYIKNYSIQQIEKIKNLYKKDTLDESEKNDDTDGTGRFIDGAKVHNRLVTHANVPPFTFGIFHISIICVLFCTESNTNIYFFLLHLLFI